MESHTYRQLAHKNINTLVKKYWYHTYIKNQLLEILEVVKVDPQKGYEQVEIFASEELHTILCMEHDQVALMLDFITDFLPDGTMSINDSLIKVNNEIEKIVHEYNGSMPRQVEDSIIATELYELYHNHIIPLLN